MKEAIKRSVTVIIVVVLSVAIGYYASILWDRAERREYPLKYSEYVEKYAAAFGVPLYTAYAVIKTESDFDATAQSHAGAIGLMQITPATFADISERLGDSYEQGMMYDPQTNIRYGCFYLSYLYHRFEDWELVFAAYNAGMGKVGEWLSDPSLLDEDGHLCEIPYEETRIYVKKVTDTVKKYEDLYSLKNASVTEK